MPDFHLEYINTSVLIPGMDTTFNTYIMAALSAIIGALIGSIMIPVYVIRAIYVFMRTIIWKIED